MRGLKNRWFEYPNVAFDGHHHIVCTDSVIPPSNLKLVKK